MNPMNGNTVCRSCFRSYVTVPHQPSRLRTQGQQQECQQQHPQQPHCQDQGVNHQAQQVNQNINMLHQWTVQAANSFSSTVCFAGYKEWQEGVKRLDFHCIVLGKKLSCQHRTPTTPNTNFTSVGFCCDVLHHSGKFHTWHLNWGKSNFTFNV